jgi:hypothetical protein
MCAQAMGSAEWEAFNPLDDLLIEHEASVTDRAAAVFDHSPMGLFSLITLWAAEAKVMAVLQPRSAAWYVKDELTFSDAIATVRRVLWGTPNLSTSRKTPDTIEIPIALLQRLTEALCYAT